MEKIIHELKCELHYKMEMIGTTARTEWFDKGFSQEAWDEKEENECQDLEKAIDILQKFL